MTMMKKLQDVRKKEREGKKKNKTIIMHQPQLTSNSTSNSYFKPSIKVQHVPNQRVPSGLDSSLNQSLSSSLFFLTYCNGKKDSKEKPEKKQELGEHFCASKGCSTVCK